MKTIDFVAKNVHGAWCVYGILGVRCYYGYTKKEAVERYQEEAKKNVFVNKR